MKNISRQFIQALIFVLFIIAPLVGNAQNYWQQEVNYVINVTLDDKKHELHAFESIVYKNNSPDVLSEIYMHLWPNAYKDRSTALCKQKVENGSTRLYYAKEKDRGYIDSLDFRVNGEIVKWEYDEENIDICRLILPAPLNSGDQITITTPFRVKIPKGVYSRLGHIGESYQITQWYPKPAVYDYLGWHPMPYLDQGEFYSEFGSFDVSITVPENYMIGSTGDLNDGEQEVEWLMTKVEETKKYLADLENKPKEKSKGSDKIEDIVFPPSSEKTKTLRYTQSRIHDFGWFADKRWHVLKGEVKLPHSEKMVDTWVMFTDDEADLWKDGIEYMNDAVYYYSLWNGDYPYQHATAVDGALSAGGGMEYPNVTVIGTSGSAMRLETVIMHEVGHNWFYGILGSNERDHPWMDEGLNSFNEDRYIETKYPDNRLAGEKANSKLAKIFDFAHYRTRALYYNVYLVNARSNYDQPIELNSVDYSQLNYFGIVYGKTALVFNYLMAYLGEETIDKAMQQFYETWKFKHPYPKDLKIILEEVSEKNLDWFFDDMINSSKKLDYKIVKVKTLGKDDFIRVKNTGEVKGPFCISGLKNGKVVTEVWYEGFEGVEDFGIPPGDYDEYRIDPLLDMPETHRNNNTIRTGGIFKKTEPLRLQLAGSLENPDKTQLFYMPIIGWNDHDHTMFGMAFYNTLLPQKKLDFVLMPLYSTSTNTLLGSADIGYTINPKGNIFQSIRLNISGARYSNGELYSVISETDGSFGELVQFNKIKPRLSFRLKNKKARSKVSNEIVLSHYNLSFTHKPHSIIYNDANPTVFVSTFPSPDYYVNVLKWAHRNKKRINPYRLNLTLEQSADFVKASLDAKYTLSYRGNNKGLDIRLFTGRFLYTNIPSTEGKFGYAMSGNSDYLFDNVMLGRGEATGLLSNQIVPNDGGFKNSTSTSPAQTWLTAINLQTSILRKIPIDLYADIGWSSADPTEVVYDAGVALILVNNVFEVYFPFYTSTEMPYPQYEKNIRFVLNLAAINPFELIRKLPH